MAEEVSGARSYRSPLRQRQTARTREAILSALADEIVDGGLHDLSVASVAARADISERTVYRHFANVDAMLAALRTFVGERLHEHMADRPMLVAEGDASIDDLVDNLHAIYAAFSAIGNPMRAVAIMTLTYGDDRARMARRDALGEALAPELAHLDPTLAQGVIELLHLFGGSLAYFLLTRDGKLTSQEAGDASVFVTKAVLAGIRAQRAARQ